VTRPTSPLWITAAIEALFAFKQRTGHDPEVALIGRKVERDMIEYSGRSDLLYGCPTRVIDDDPWRGVEWA
jgi:hypothetical protein